MVSENLKALVGNNAEQKIKVNKLEDKIYGTISKEDNARLTVASKTYKGSQYIDFRVEWKDNSGNWHPTSKGFTLGVEAELIEEFRNVVSNVIDELNSL